MRGLQNIMKKNVFSSNAFSGKRALITGATGGIGREIARILSSSGGEVIITDFEATRLEELSVSLPSNTTIFAGDLSDSDSIKELVSVAGEVDFLLHVAGVYPESPLQTMTDEELDRVFNINVKAVFALTREIEPHLNDGGAIVNFGSIAGARGSKNHSHYAATKGAISSFSKSMALELADRNIRVNTIAPGIIKTPMIKDLMDTSGNSILINTPLGRLGTAEEVAGAAAFLCSDLATFITGETIHVNGGFYMA